MIRKRTHSTLLDTMAVMVHLWATVSKFAASIFIWIFLSFMVVPFFLTIFTLRFLISKLVPLLDGSTTKILTTTSSNFAAVDDRDKYHVVFCFELEGVVDLSDVRSTFECRVIQKKKEDGNLQWPELQQFIVHKFGYPFWKWDKSFNIQKHIRLLEVDPKFGENGLSPQDILDVIEERVIHKPFLPQQSPWEILIVPNFKNMPNYGSGIDGSGVGTMLVFHFDHAFGDGTAISNVFEEFFDGRKTPMKSLNPITKNWFSSVWHKVKFYFFGPYELINLGNLGQKFYWSPNTKKTKYNAAVSPTIPAEFIKSISKANSATFSSVVLISIGNALVKFMNEAGYEVPETVCCSLARLADGHPLTKLRNHITLIQAELPTRRNFNQLGLMQEKLTAFNQSRVPGMYFLASRMIGGLFTTWNQRILNSVVGDGEFAFTNLQSFKDELRFKEVGKLRSIFSCGRVPNGGNGIVIICAGCHEGIRLLFQIDEGVVPKNQLHAQVFIKYFLEELESMSQNADSV